MIMHVKPNCSDFLLLIRRRAPFRRYGNINALKCGISSIICEMTRTLFKSMYKYVGLLGNPPHAIHAPPPKRPTNRKYTNTSLKMPFATNKHQWENTNLLLLSLVQFSSWTHIVGANFLTITCSLRNYGNESKHTYFHPTLPYIEASIRYSQIKILKNMHVVSLVKQKPCK